MNRIDLARPRVLLVDDDPAQLEILASWLEGTGFEPICANDGFEAVTRMREQRFDVIVTDLRMPGMGGLQLLGIIQQLDPTVQVIFLSGQGTLDEVVEALRQGRAFDFLTKPLRDLHQLNAVLQRALARRRRGSEPVPVRPSAPAPIVTLHPRTEPVPSHLEPLSGTELRLVNLLACGLDNRRIAEELHFSEKTVRNYLSRIYDKLGVGSRLQAVAICQRYGMVERGRLANAS